MTYKTRDEQADDRRADYMFVSVSVKYIIRRSVTSPSFHRVRSRQAKMSCPFTFSHDCWEDVLHPEPRECGTEIETRDQWRHAMMLVIGSPRKRDGSITQENKCTSVYQSVIKLSNEKSYLLPQWGLWKWDTVFGGDRDFQMYFYDVLSTINESQFTSIVFARRFSGGYLKLCK